MSHLCLILLGGMESGERQLEVEPCPPKSIEPHCDMRAVSILRSVRLEIHLPTIHPVGTTSERVYQLLAFMVSLKQPNVKSVAHSAVHVDERARIQPTPSHQRSVQHNGHSDSNLADIDATSIEEYRTASRNSTGRE
jgi:hypothetical protein